jgi:hypothetical protein
MCKTWGQLVGRTWGFVCKISRHTHSFEIQSDLGVGKWVGYTQLCTQNILGLYTTLPTKITSVKLYFYPLSTRPITSSYN